MVVKKSKNLGQCPKEARPTHPLIRIIIIQTSLYFIKGAQQLLSFIENYWGWCATISLGQWVTMTIQMMMGGFPWVGG